MIRGYFWLLLLAAVIPPIILLRRIYKKDRLDKEPKGMLFSLVLLGIVATWLAILGETVGCDLLDNYYSGSTLNYLLLENILVVGVSEEGAKYLLLRIRTWRSRHFDCSFDGVVYAVFVSLGFALWENIDYVFLYGFSTALLRAVTAIPGHTCFGVFMGVFYAKAKMASVYGQRGKSHICCWLAFLVPMLLHGVYDVLASLEGTGGTVLFVGYIIVLFIVSIIVVNSASSGDRRFAGFPREQDDIIDIYNR